MAEQQCEPCLMGCGNVLTPKGEILGLEVFNRQKIGICSECYKTKTSEEISTRLITHPEQDFFVCIEEHNTSNDEEVVYHGCGQLFSDIHGKHDFANCCEDCAKGRGVLDVIDDQQLILKIKSSEFGRDQCSVPM